MKILWISQNIPYPPKTGVLQRNYNLVREAARYGDVTLLAVWKKDILPEGCDIDEARNELGKFCSRIEIVDLPIESSRLLFYFTVIRSLFSKDPFSINWIKCRALADKIRQLMRESDYDIVHFDTISLATYQDLTGETAKILNHHNIESHLFKRRASIEENPLRRFYYALEGSKLERYEHKICPKFDINFTVSELDGQRLLEIAPSAKCDVIANGVDVDYFAPLSRNQIDDRSVIMVSGMNWFPNRDAVLYMCDHIWPALSEAYPDISWVVVGASPPKQLFDLAERDSRVTVTGFVDDVRPYMARAHVYLCPMRDGGGTRLKILDALSMALPIVATTMAYEGISVTPERDVLVADDADAFVEQIGRLFNDENLCERLGEKARQFVINNYSWPVIGRRLDAIYREISGGR